MICTPIGGRHSRSVQGSGNNRQTDCQNGKEHRPAPIDITLKSSPETDDMKTDLSI